MTKKIFLMDLIMESIIELAKLNERSVQEEIRDMASSFEVVMDEVPAEERDQTVNWV